jgi:glyoxylase-like metal-dependent hydrolase (beta-lactamase superfamily II)
MPTGTARASASVFTADVTLCPPEGWKRTSPENFTSLINDVSSRLSDMLPDDTSFYPGHGDDSTLGEQKPHIDEWRERGW